MSVRFSLVPYRFSDNPAGMTRFLEALGLRAANGAVDSNFARLRGRSGTVAVHSAGGSATGAPAGETQLSFEVEDVQKAADVLAAAGLNPVTWDGSVGRHAGVREPRGGGVWINEVGDAHDTAEASDVDVIAVYYIPDFATAAGFFAHLGFTSDGTGDEWWRALHGAERMGVIGLHRVDEAPPLRAASPHDPMGPPTTIELGFETTEDLPKLAERLREAEYPDAVVADDHGLVRVLVTDPDGQRLEIHSAG